LLLSACALACTIAATDAAAATSELDSFEAAVASQTKQAALAFIGEFSSSHLVGDLIELLRPEVAHEVCADLPSSAASALDACRKLDVRLATPQTASEEPQPILSRESTVEPEPLQSSAHDAAADSQISDAAISPGAGTSEPTRALASARSRRGTTGEHSGEKTVVVPLVPRLADSSPESDDDTHAKKPASTEEPEKKVPKSQQSASSDPFPGSDPGSDPGSASSPSSQGKDPGSDPGSDSGNDGDRDSHN
jgi:hypothetical protein